MARIEFGKVLASQVGADGLPPKNGIIFLDTAPKRAIFGTKVLSPEKPPDASSDTLPARMPLPSFSLRDEYLRDPQKNAELTEYLNNNPSKNADDFFEGLNHPSADSVSKIKTPEPSVFPLIRKIKRALSSGQPEKPQKKTDKPPKTQKQIRSVGREKYNRRQFLLLFGTGAAASLIAGRGSAQSSKINSLFSKAVEAFELSINSNNGYEVFDYDSDSGNFQRNQFGAFNSWQARFDTKLLEEYSQNHPEAELVFSRDIKDPGDDEAVVSHDLLRVSNGKIIFSDELSLSDDGFLTLDSVPSTNNSTLEIKFERFKDGISTTKQLHRISQRQYEITSEHYPEKTNLRIISQINPESLPPESAAYLQSELSSFLGFIPVPVEIRLRDKDWRSEEGGLYRVSKGQIDISSSPLFNTDNLEDGRIVLSHAFACSLFEEIDERPEFDGINLRTKSDLIMFRERLHKILEGNFATEVNFKTLNKYLSENFYLGTNLFSDPETIVSADSEFFASLLNLLKNFGTVISDYWSENNSSFSTTEKNFFDTAISLAYFTARSFAPEEIRSDDNASLDFIEETLIPNIKYIANKTKFLSGKYFPKSTYILENADRQSKQPIFTGH